MKSYQTGQTWVKFAEKPVARAAPEMPGAGAASVPPAEVPAAGAAGPFAPTEEPKDEFGPGPYKTLHEVGVSHEAQVSKDFIQLLPEDTRIKIVEVKRTAEFPEIIRGRLERGGWISMKDDTTSQTWVQPIVYEVKAEHAEKRAKATAKAARKAKNNVEKVAEKAKEVKEKAEKAVAKAQEAQKKAEEEGTEEAKKDAAKIVAKAKEAVKAVKQAAKSVAEAKEQAKSQAKSAIRSKE